MLTVIIMASLNFVTLFLPGLLLNMGGFTGFTWKQDD